MTFFRTLLFTIAAVTLTSCTWVKLTPEGQNVEVMTQADLANCERTGTTTVEVLDKVLLERNPEKVEQELQTLARNRAAGRGDVIVASSGIEDGEQQFVIYRCSN